MIRQILTLPDSMIQRRIDRRGLRLEAILILICGLLGGIGTAYVAVQAMGAVSGENSQLQFAFIGQVLSPLVYLFLVWIGYTLVSHILASQFRGRGPISRLLRTSAWSLVPIGIWYLIQSIVTVYLFFSVEFQTNPEGLNADEEFRNIMDLGLDGSLLYIVTLFAGVLFVVWSWYLLADAVEKAKTVSTDDARKIAAVPAAAYGLYVLWTALQSAGIV